MTLSERINCTRKITDGAIEIDPRKDINYYETLCEYVSDYDICLDSVTEKDFDGAVTVLTDYSKSVEMGNFYFWID